MLANQQRLFMVKLCTTRYKTKNSKLYTTKYKTTPNYFQQPYKSKTKWRKLTWKLTLFHRFFFLMAYESFKKENSCLFERKRKWFAALCEESFWRENCQSEISRAEILANFSRFFSSVDRQLEFDICPEVLG